MRNFFLLFFAFFAVTLSAQVQQITGHVADEKTGEAVPFVNVFFEGGSGVQADEEGNFSIPFRTGRLYISSIGYETRSFRIRTVQHLDVKLMPNDRSLKEAQVSGKRDKYSRKNNPAVELMKKVIAAKKKSDLREHSYYSIDKYNKLTFALNEVTDKIFEEGKFKRMPFLKEHVEVCNETGKLILPLSVDETVTRDIYRKEPHSEKEIVVAHRNNGINELLNTGDIMTTMLQDCFTEVNIYEDEVRLLQYPFISPVSSRSGISFYRYFIEDTVFVEGAKCIEVSFTPNNPQDFGFSGSLYVLADSTYRIRKVMMGIPGRSDVNFVESMRIDQEFGQLPTGEQVLLKDNMLVQLKIAKGIQKMMVRRVTEYSNFSFEPIPDKTFKFKGDKLTEADAMMRSDEYWNEHRPEQLTDTEDRMSLLVKRLQQVKGFKPIMWIGKAFIENFVETSLDPAHPSKVDIGPVNTMISQNFVDGLRLRASAQTTANLNPHLFLKGYVAYGFKDQRWKGMGEVTYSFNKKAYLPREFPVSNLTFTYSNDVISPSDQFMPTDKDNVFTSFKWTTVDHMMYNESYKLLFDQEWANGLRLKFQLRRERNEPTAALFYQPLSAGVNVTDAAGNVTGRAPSTDWTRLQRFFTTTDFTFGITYQPGAKWINTKQRRIAANNDAPIYRFSHTVGVKGVLKSDCNFNLTEAGIYKRFWIGSWGKIDTDLRGGVQWNRVPFPLLIMPAANLSYIMEDNTFSLIDNMEFLNDRYVSFMGSWDLNGKIFNRVPLLKRLKWREYVGVNVLWGTLSSKNNPFDEKNYGRDDLFFFPGHFNSDGSFSTLSRTMDKKVPYVEAIVGVHNIFKIFHVEYVRRLTYIGRDGTQKWGIRFMFRVTF